MNITTRRKKRVSDLAYYHRNKEEINARRKEKYEANPETHNERSRAYYVANKEKVKARNSAYYVANKEKQCKSNKRWYVAHREETLAKRRAKSKLPAQRRKKKAYAKEYCLKKYHGDALFKLRLITSTSIRRGLKKQGFSKTARTHKILGCSFIEFKSYIENQFKEGMSWENHGRLGWELDHIVPQCLAETKEEVFSLNHYSNFQPLWAEENGPSNKGDKLIPILISPENKIRYAEILARHEAS